MSDEEKQVSDTKTQMTDREKQPTVAETQQSVRETQQSDGEKQMSFVRSDLVLNQTAFAFGAFDGASENPERKGKQND